MAEKKLQLTFESNAAKEARNVEQLENEIKQLKDQYKKAALGSDEFERAERELALAQREHAKLYGKALDHMMVEAEAEYYVCGVCGHISDGELPDECPICGAPGEKFRKVI